MRHVAALHRVDAPLEIEHVGCLGEIRFAMLLQLAPEPGVEAIEQRAAGRQQFYTTIDTVSFDGPGSGP